MATETVSDAASPTDDDLRRRVGANVKTLREAKGMSQYGLAEAVGLRKAKYLDVARIAKLERGEIGPGAALLVRLARVLETTVEVLCAPPKKS